MRSFIGRANDELTYLSHDVVAFKDGFGLYVVFFSINQLVVAFIVVVEHPSTPWGEAEKKSYLYILGCVKYACKMLPMTLSACLLIRVRANYYWTVKQAQDITFQYFISLFTTGECVFFSIPKSAILSPWLYRWFVFHEWRSQCIYCCK